MQQDIKYFELMEWVKMMENNEKLKEQYEKERHKKLNNRKIKSIPDRLYFEDSN